MTIAPEPEDSITTFLEKIATVSLIGARFNADQILEYCNAGFHPSSKSLVLDESFQNAIFSIEAGDEALERNKKFRFSIVQCMQLSESDARQYMQNHIMNCNSLDTSEFKEIYLLCTAAELYYQAARSNRKELIHVVTSEWAQYLAHIPLPGTSSLFSFLKQLCDRFISFLRSRAPANREHSLAALGLRK